MYPQPIGVVQERDCLPGFVHLGELSALLPGVGPCAVVQRVPDGVIGNAYAVIGGKLVPPVIPAVGDTADGGLPVGEGVSLGGRQGADTSCCVDICFVRIS